jgi:hypothetical protein
MSICGSCDVFFFLATISGQQIFRKGDNMKRRLLTALFLVTAIVLFMTLREGNAAPERPATQSQAQENGRANKFRRVGKPFRDHYIVVLKKDTPGDKVEAVANQLLARHGGTTRHIYKSALKGFSIQMPEAAAMALSREPQVAYVEEDGQAFLSRTQTNPPWGIDRIDQRSHPLSHTYNFDNVNTGAGVHAYVIDSGIQTAHTEFLTPTGASRVVRDYDAIWWDFQGSNDCTGHGTAVASVVGGNTFGVAKDVTLHAIRVFGCTDWTLPSNIIAGVDWVKDHHLEPAVVNMSLHVPWVDDALEDAIRDTMATGVTFVVAAGNSGENASGFSPARMPEVITVGAISTDDHRTDFSNFGPSVDVFAPGVGITSARHLDTDGNGILDDVVHEAGTSFSAPHATGVAARFLQSYANATPAAVEGAIKNSATRDKVVDPGEGSSNLLLYSRIRTAMEADVSVSVPESESLVDSGVDVGPNQWLAISGYGNMWAAPEILVPPEGWYILAPTAEWPLPGDRRHSLVGMLDPATFFYIGRSHATSTNFSSPTRLFLGTNDIIFGDGTGNFDCGVQLWKKLPDVSADFVSQSVPATIVAGQTASVSVTMKNVGTTTWRASELYRLGSQNPQDNLTWGRSRVSVPATVVPTQTWTFTFDITAPSTPGVYNFQWMMLQEFVQWFGDVTPSVPITVLATSNQAEFVSQTVQKSMYAGGQYNASVTMRNVGNSTWQTGTNYWLGSQNPQDNTRWGMNRVVLPNPVPPGSQVTFNFVVTAPLKNGMYSFQWRMVQDGVEWFGASTPSVTISVKPVCDWC